MCAVNNRACIAPTGSGPVFCPTIHHQALVEQAVKEYEKPAIQKFAHMASVQEAECYTNRHIKPYVLHPITPRVQEICEFSKKMGYTKLGVAFCGGLRSEAQALTDILRAQGFKVVSVICKVGCTPKEALGLQEEEKINIGQFESMCSPIAQAFVLNQAKTDFNIVVGLCVGHDSLFFKYSNAFTTVLVAKDRVLAHNPVGALYTKGSYYARMLTPKNDSLKENSQPSACK
jgi:uncharacterized metal-binding protein